MAKGIQYSIVYLVPGSSEKRYKQAITANPGVLAEKFQLLNPRATIVRIFNSLTGDNIYEAAQDFQSTVSPSVRK